MPAWPHSVIAVATREARGRQPRRQSDVFGCNNKACAPIRRNWTTTLTLTGVPRGRRDGVRCADVGLQCSITSGQCATDSRICGVATARCYITGAPAHTRRTRTCGSPRRWSSSMRSLSPAALSGGVRHGMSALDSTCSSRRAPGAKVSETLQRTPLPSSLSVVRRHFLGR